MGVGEKGGFGGDEEPLVYLCICGRRVEFLNDAIDAADQKEASSFPSLPLPPRTSADGITSAIFSLPQF